MAHGDRYTCLTCGKPYRYCSQCAIVPVAYYANGFCSSECADIFNTLSLNGAHLVGAKETLEALEKYDIDHMSLAEPIRKHIDVLKKECVDVAAETIAIEGQIIDVPQPTKVRTKKKETE